MKISSYPYHVAVIMDGNGRWATQRHRPRFWGHLRGASTVSHIVEKGVDLSLKSLTLFAFSTENWSRPEKEVSFLFKLLDKFLAREKQKILDNNIRFKVIGKFDFLSEETLLKISQLEELTDSNDGMILNFAFGYGGRQEIVESANKFIKAHPGKKISESDFSKSLFDSRVPDIDLLIRTGGEKRVSNFMLWQMSYAELFFTNTYWPNFKPSEFEEILSEVSCRQRRFGQVPINSEKRTEQ